MKRNKVVKIKNFISKTNLMEGQVKTDAHEVNQSFNYYLICEAFQLSVLSVIRGVSMFENMVLINIKILTLKLKLIEYNIFFNLVLICLVYINMD